MTKFSISTLAIAVGLVFSAGAMAQTMSRNQYKFARSGIAAEYQSATAACGSLSDHAKDLCKAEASGKSKVAKAELKARYKPSEDARYKVRVARAAADSSVANKADARKLAASEKRDAN